MRNRINRRRLLASLAMGFVGIAGAAWAADQVIIHFTAASSVVTGQNVATSVTVNQAPMSVTFTSNPPGLANYTTTVTSPNQSVAVPTSSGAPAGSYTLTATPSAGGTSKSVGILATRGVGN